MLNNISLGVDKCMTYDKVYSLKCMTYDKVYSLKMTRYQLNEKFSRLIKGLKLIFSFKFKTFKTQLMYKWEQCECLIQTNILLV